jgi:hypothetical protein
MKIFGVKFKLLIILAFFRPAWCLATTVEQIQGQIRAVGNLMLENLEVSYVYGGSKIGGTEQCEKCNKCLELKQPAPKERFKLCHECTSCSLDCSHFVQLVFANSGLDFPYLTSQQMLDLDRETLRRKYHLVPVSDDPGSLIAGDLLVYRGHVVIAESIHDFDKADIIHATGGRDIREPGQGIQRERFVKPSSFRGPLLRVLRHEKLMDHDAYSQAQGQEMPTTKRAKGAPFKLRPVAKKIRTDLE